MNSDNTSSSSTEQSVFSLLSRTPPLSALAITTAAAVAVPQRYTRSALYLFRNDAQSKRRPESALRTELISLGIWKLNSNVSANVASGGTHSQNGNDAVNGITSGSTNSNNINMNSSIHITHSHTNARLQRSPSMRSNFAANDHHASVAIPYSTSHATPHSHHLNTKHYADQQRSISSAHLMPAFVKRRIGAAPPPPQVGVVGGAYVGSSVGGAGVSLIGGVDANKYAATRSETPNGIVKDQLSIAHQKTKETICERQRTNEQYAGGSYLSPQRNKQGDTRDPEINSGSVSPAKSSNNTNNNNNTRSSSTNNERRIGSGRLLHCDVNWDYRGAKKDNCKKMTNSGAATTTNVAATVNIGGDNELTTRQEQKPQQRTNARLNNADREMDRDNDNGRLGPTNCFTERRSLDRSGRSNDVESGDILESGHHSNATDTTLNPSLICYSRRFNDTEMNSNTVQLADKHSARTRRSHHHHRYNHNERMNDEPEWFSGGPISQHDTIELRGFDEIDEHYGNSCNKNLRSKLSECLTFPASSSNTNNISVPKIQDTQKMKELQHNGDYDDNTHNDDGKIPTTATVASDGIKLRATQTLTTPTRVTTKTDTFNEIDNNEDVGLTDFNFDAFLNMDPLTHTLVFQGTNVKSDEDAGLIASSRFSRWFVNKNIQPEMDEHSTAKQKERCVNNERMEKDENSGATFVQSNKSQEQTNTLMQFLQRNKIPPSLPEGVQQQHLGGIPSVEELESRMRKIRLSNESTTKDEGGEGRAAPLFNKANPQLISHLPENLAEAAQPTSVPISNTPQDTEAFKKLLQQLGSGSQQNEQQLQQHQPKQRQANQRSTEKQEEEENFSKTHSSLNITQLPVAHAALSAAASNYQNEEMERQHLLHHHHHQQQRQLQYEQATIQQSQNIVFNSEKSVSVIPGVPSPREMKFYASSLIPHSGNGGTLLKQKFEEDYFRERQQVMRKHSTHSSVAMGNLKYPLEMDISQKAQPQSLHGSHKSSITGLMAQSSPSSSSSPQNRKMLQTPSQQLSSAPALASINTIQNNQQHRHIINSPSPLAFTPTSVLRKMTADKDNTNAVAVVGTQQHQQQTLNQLDFSTSLPPHQRLQPQLYIQVPNNKNLQSSLPLNQYNLMQQHQQQQPQQQHHQQQQSLQQSQIITPQPRMILGGGNHSQHLQLGNTGQQLAQQQQQQQVLQHPAGIHAAQQAQRLRNSHQQLKWQIPSTVLAQQQMSATATVAKPIGRPILKGPLQSFQTQQQQQQQQPPMTYASKIEYQQIQQQQQKPKVGASIQQHFLPQQQLALAQQQPQTAHANLMTHVQQQILQQQQQRTALQRAQHMQFQNMQQQQHLHRATGVIGKSGGGNQAHHSAGVTAACSSNSSSSSGATASAATSSLISYQRDGGLSPTSNQLAQWFSPELLAQASAGKLPLLNVNQALSLEEFERSIQHSSTIVHN